MMNYEMFKGIIEAELSNYLSDEYKDMKVEIFEANKVNFKADAVCLRNVDTNEVYAVSPVLYLQDMYNHYVKCGSLPEVMSLIADQIDVEMKQGSKMLKELMADDIKERIVLQLINSEQNKDLLSEVPHRPFKDLDVIYRVMAKNDKVGVFSAIINNQGAKLIGLNEQELFDLAVENTRRINPVKIVGMSELMKDLFSQADYPDELVDVAMEDMGAEERMYVISNQSNVNGAASLLFEEELHEFTEKIDDDIYIIPSSIHECIALPSKYVDDPEFIAQTVYEINMNVLDVGDRLSNQVYYYDKDQRTLEFATDSPKKSIGDNVAEKSQDYIAKPKTI